MRVNPVKPVNLNQLLFHPRSESLSFFLSHTDEPLQFIQNLLLDLEQEEKPALKSILEKKLNQILKIVKSHPGCCHGFFLASDLEGYIVLDQNVDSYSVTGETFHVRPLLEGLFVNPEFMIVNISLYDIKIYRGDFQNLEIIQQYEFDQLPSNFTDLSRIYAPQYLGLIPYKTILAIKTIAQKVREFILYQSLPVIITGLDEMKGIFLRYFDDAPGVITHFEADFYEKTCVEISHKCKEFRYAVMDYYSAKLKERLKRMMNSRRLLTDMKEIIRATYAGNVVHLVIPVEQKIWGKFNPETGDFIIHKKSGKTSVDILNELAEEVMKQGGRIQVLGPHFFPQNANVLAILKGSL